MGRTEHNIFFPRNGVPYSEGMKREGEILRQCDVYEQLHKKWCCICGQRNLHDYGVYEEETKRWFCNKCYPIRERVIKAHRRQNENCNIH